MMAQETAAPDSTTPAPRTVQHENLDPVRVVEAALFSAGKPLAIEEIAENTRMDRRRIEKALNALKAEYAERDTALEVAKAGAKWAMQVRAKFVEATHRLAPMEIPIKLLKTLALIAYHQPVLQSQLIDMVGAKGYEHVGELVERGLVKKRVHERSYMLVTSDLFPEYFGIPAEDRNGIKNFLAEKVGIKPKGQQMLTTSAAPETAPAPAGPDEAPAARAEAAPEADEAAQGADAAQDPQQPPN